MRLAAIAATDILVLKPNRTTLADGLARIPPIILIPVLSLFLTLSPFPPLPLFYFPIYSVPHTCLRPEHIIVQLLAFISVMSLPNPDAH